MSFEFVTKLPTPTEIKEQYPVPEEIKALLLFQEFILTSQELQE